MEDANITMESNNFIFNNRHDYIKYLYTNDIDMTNIYMYGLSDKTLFESELSKLIPILDNPLDLSTEVSWI